MARAGARAEIVSIVSEVVIANTRILFDYDSSRSGEVAKRLLEEFSGILQTDAYDGYNAVVTENGLTQVYWTGSVHGLTMIACRQL